MGGRSYTVIWGVFGRRDVGATVVSLPAASQKWVFVLVLFRVHFLVVALNGLLILISALARHHEIPGLLQPCLTLFIFSVMFENPCEVLLAKL